MLLKISALFAALLTLMCVYADGDVFYGEAQGYSGEIRVRVELKDGAISSVTLLECGESSGLGDLAAQKIADDIVERNTAAVDAVSGATATSMAVCEAAQSALACSTAQLAERSVEPAAVSDGSCDVLIIGSGAAALTAAVRCAEKGLRVTVAFPEAVPGGKAALCQSSFSAGDSAQYLTDCGALFITAASGGVRLIPVNENGERGAGTLIAPLLTRAAALGVALLSETEPISLRMEGSERVSGARFRCAGGVFNISCGAVVLCGGGSELAKELGADTEDGVVLTGDGGEALRDGEAFRGLYACGELGADTGAPDEIFDAALRAADSAAAALEQTR